MNPTAALEFSEWLAENEPQLFNALATRAMTEAKMPTHAQMSGIWDAISSVGSKIASGISGVASFLTSQQGIETIGTLGGAYMQNQTQKAALDLQLARAQSGQPPAAVQNTLSPSGVVVPYSQTTGQPLSAQQLAALYPARTALSGYLPWIIGGGALLAAVMFARS